MGIIRNILAVILGYLIFAVGAVMLFRFGGIDPHADAAISTIALVIICGAIFAFIGGYAAKLVAATRTIKANFALAILMAGFAAFSLFKSDGCHYTQIAAIFLFAPVSVAGGFLRLRSET